MHGDVVLQVRVGEEDVGVGSLHLLQEAREVGRAEIEFLAEHDGEVSRVLVVPLLDALLVVDAVIGVLQRQRQLQALVELALVHQAAEILRGRVAQEIGRAEGAEDPLVAAAEDGGGRGAGGDPGRLVAVRHHRLGLAQRRRIAAEHGDHAVGAHGALDQARGPRLVGAVVVEDLVERQLLAARLDGDAAGVVDLVDGELDPLALILPRLRLPTGDRQDDADFDLVAPCPHAGETRTSTVTAIARTSAGRRPVAGDDERRSFSRPFTSKRFASNLFERTTPSRLLAGSESSAIAPNCQQVLPSCTFPALFGASAPACALGWPLVPADIPDARRVLLSITDGDCASSRTVAFTPNVLDPSPPLAN